MPAHELLKVDSRGRIQISAERREALLEEFDRSGISGARFAKHYGIKYTTFAHWIRARKEVMSEPAPKAQGVLIHLPNGASLTVIDTAQAELVGAVIRALGTRA